MAKKLRSKSRAPAFIKEEPVARGINRLLAEGYVQGAEFLLDHKKRHHDVWENLLVNAEKKKVVCKKCLRQFSADTRARSGLNLTSFITKHSRVTCQAKLPARAKLPRHVKNEKKVIGWRGKQLLFSEPKQDFPLGSKQPEVKEEVVDPPLPLLEPEIILRELRRSSRTTKSQLKKAGRNQVKPAVSPSPQKEVVKKSSTLSSEAKAKNLPSASSSRATVNKDTSGNNSCQKPGMLNTFLFNFR